MRFFTKKGNAIKKWHSRAMVIDLSRTRVTFITSAELGKHNSFSRKEKGVRLSATLIEPSKKS